jgi:hypothetical protein
MSAPRVHSAVAEPCQLRQHLEIQVGEGVRLRASRLDPVLLQKIDADQVRRLAVADVDARLAEIHRQELRMHVGDVQQAHIAEARHFVQLVCRAQGRDAGTQRAAGGGGESEEAEKLPALQPAYWLTGEAGSSR